MSKSPRTDRGWGMDDAQFYRKSAIDAFMAGASEVCHCVEVMLERSRKIMGNDNVTTKVLENTLKEMKAHLAVRYKSFGSPLVLEALRMGAQPIEEDRLKK